MADPHFDQTKHTVRRKVFSLISGAGGKAKIDAFKMNYYLRQSSVS